MKEGDKKPHESWEPEEHFIETNAGLIARVARKYFETFDLAEIKSEAISAYWSARKYCNSFKKTKLTTSFVFFLMKRLRLLREEGLILCQGRTAAAFEEREDPLPEDASLGELAASEVRYSIDMRSFQYVSPRLRDVIRLLANKGLSSDISDDIVRAMDFKRLPHALKTFRRKLFDEVSKNGQGIWVGICQSDDGDVVMIVCGRDKAEASRYLEAHGEVKSLRRVSSTVMDRGLSLKERKRDRWTPHSTGDVMLKTGFNCPSCKQSVLAYKQPRRCSEHD